MKRRSITALLGVSCLALVLVSGPKASAQAECPYLYTECPVLFALVDIPGSGGFPTNQFEPGEDFGLFGFNFPVETGYVIFFDQNPTIELGSVTTDDDGRFVVGLTIPDAAQEDVPAALIARPADADSGLPVATLGVLITDDPFRPQADDDSDDDATNGAVDDAAADADDGGARLPTTGTDVALFGTYGAVLLAAGWALVAYARRRRPASSPDLDPAYRVPDLLPADWSEPLTKA